MISLDWQSQTFNSNCVDFFEKVSGSVHVFFGIYNNNKHTADHRAVVKQSDAMYHYSLAGHGVSGITAEFTNLESLVERISQDCRIFNLTDKVWLEAIN
ncbi:MAG: hypothetical protein ABG776_15230 [Cyanobacteria bacterium J06555_13]